MANERPKPREHKLSLSCHIKGHCHNFNRLRVNNCLEYEEMEKVNRKNIALNFN